MNLNRKKLKVTKKALFVYKGQTNYSSPNQSMDPTVMTVSTNYPGQSN